MNEQEMKLQYLLSMVTPPNETARELALTHWDRCAKPLGSLGVLEEDLIQIAALTGSDEFDFSRSAVLVLCADNGVTAEGVSQTGSEVTAKVANQLAQGTTSVCRMAETTGCTVVPVDLGILDYPGNPKVLDRRITNGTGNISKGIAMTRQETVSAILTGIRLVKEQKGAGYTLLAAGEMGIGNTTTSAAVTSVLLGQDPSAVTGRGSGLGDSALQHKTEVIRNSIALNEPIPYDPIDVLSKVGGLDIAGLCGVFLGGAIYQIPVLMDGLISSVAALCAVRLCPAAEKSILASHVSSEPAAAMVLQELQKKPLIAADLHLGEGTGAVAAIPLLKMAAAVYHKTYTFDEGGIPQYHPW